MVCEYQEELTFVMRKLLYFMRDLPTNTAYILFNYLVSCVCL